MSSVIKLELFLAFSVITLNLVTRTTSQPSPYGYKNQYIRDSSKIQLNQIKPEKLCTNFWCINDAYYIFSKASQYKNVDPCIDFKNFTVNQIDEVDAIDDRYIYRGFQLIIDNKYSERLRKVVEKPSKDDKNRIVKVLKNVFKKCRSSQHTFRHLEAHRDIINYLQSLGGSPYISKHLVFNPNRFDISKDFKINSAPGNISDEKALWNETRFKVEKVFDVEPWNALNFFFNVEVQRCDNGFVCLKPSKYQWSNIIYHPKFASLFYGIYLDILETLEDYHVLAPNLKKYVETEMFRPAIDRMIQFLKIKDKTAKDLVEQFNYTNDYVTIAKLNQLIPYIDWLKIINNELLEHSKVDENETIYIENGGSQVLAGLANLVLNYDKRSIADAFAISFIERNRVTLILHYYGKTDQFITGAKHGPQRWERCLDEYLTKTVHPALLVLYEQHRENFDRNVGDFERNKDDDRVKILESAEAFTKEAIDVYKNVFINNTNLEPGVSIDILQKLKNITIIISLNEKVFPFNRLEEFYQDLNLNGSENFLLSYIEMSRFKRKVLNEKSDSWRRKIEIMVDPKKGLTYGISDGNFFYIPPKYILYPNYHPLRPRFFNLATLCFDIIFTMDGDLKHYIRNNHNEVDLSKYTTGISQVGVPQAIFESYREWLKTHEEKEIGANNLTNLQLYWMAYVLQDYRKLHRSVYETFEAQFRLQQKYLHVHIKKYDGFQEAFNCSMTPEEEAKFDEYVEKFSAIQ